MFRKILIANRGEIAVRIIRACREMGIATVAIYSEADANAQYVWLADEAECVGPPPSTDSYLRMERIIAAAGKHQCDAIHPGYGFLSENATFAEAVNAAGVCFIGPAPAPIRAVGSKTAARQRMVEAGVPVIPGYQGDSQESCACRCRKFLRLSIVGQSCGRRRGKGHETRIQRSHQKIIEETPSPFVGQALRQQMGNAAVAAARAVDYVNAGTVEFLVDAHGNFYFLEMNTRLQVEHLITELVTGLDLVKLQLQIAAGEELPFTQEDLQQRGHAIECRIYAEDPANGFAPSAGALQLVKEPQSPGVRFDSGVASGDQVSLHYDPLLAKLSVLGVDRDDAVARLSCALRESVMLGDVTTNLAFLHTLCQHPAFRAGATTTDFIDQHLANWRPSEASPSDPVLVAAALLETLERGAQPIAYRDELAGDLQARPYNPWQQLKGFRLGVTSG